MKREFSHSIKIFYHRLRAWVLSTGLERSGNYTISDGESEASEMISIIIPVHDALEDVERCFRSLERYAGKAEVILIDDGSVLQMTRDLLESARMRNKWQLYRNDKALGHSRASEIGVGMATRPILCLLNSDTIVTHHSWAGVIRAFHVSPKIAVVGPSTSWTPSQQRLARAEYCRHYWSDAQIGAFAERHVNRHRKHPLTDLNVAGGFALFVRRSVWDSLNGFDVNLPDYGNETEFCHRVLTAGYRVVWSKGCYIHHLGSKSYGQTLGMTAVDQRRTAARLYIDSLSR